MNSPYLTLPYIYNYQKSSNTIIESVVFSIKYVNYNSKEPLFNE